MNIYKIFEKKNHSSIYDEIYMGCQRKREKELSKLDDTRQANGWEWS